MWWDIERVKAYLNIEMSTEYDALLSTLGKEAAEEIETFLKQPITPTIQVYYITCVTAGQIFFYGSVQSVESVKDLDGNQITITNMIITPHKTTIYGYFTRNVVYKVTVTVGFSTVPEAILGVWTEKVVTKFFESEVAGGIKGGRLGKASIAENTQGVAATTTYKDLTSRWEAILKPYRRAII